MVLFPGRFESLSQISSYVEKTAQQAGLNPKAIYAVQLAVDEACSNIIEHAYGGEGRGDIECTVSVVPEGVQVILHDHGRPFNPEDVPQPDPQALLETCECGGAGLYLMQKLMDEVRFEFSAHSGNTCTLIKKK